MKLNIGVRSQFNKLVFIGLVLGLQACGGGGGGGAPNAAPVFTSAATISVDENNTATGYTAVATDAENNTVTFSLSGGADQARLSIDSATGVLSFNNTQDFEAAADSDTNNSYVVAITATDGTNSVNQTVTVTVTDVNEAPVFTSSDAISVDENLTATGYTAAVTDPENDTITYSLTGGTDQAQLSIDSSTGALSFQTAADFENPIDSDPNNTYVVDITATDGTLSVNQTVTVTVTDIANGNPTGYYTGSASVREDDDSTVLPITDIQILVNDGRLMIMSDADIVVYNGQMSINENAFTASMTVYKNGIKRTGALGTTTVTGTITEGTQLTGTFTGEGLGNGSFTSTYSTLNDTDSLLETVAIDNDGFRWRCNINEALEFFSLQVADTGAFDAGNSLGSSVLEDCDVLGTLTPITNTGLYAVSITTLTGCLNSDVDSANTGGFTGFAITKEDTDPNDRLVLTMTNDSYSTGDDCIKQ